ncbi:MAG: efflux RND transporter periplasmic adaptor subunit [Clostridium sp.]|nr:efflux RND transporter periplasmic adaptor subunit [Clostridium sp.]
MIRFNSTYCAAATLLACIALLTSCKNHDKPVGAGPVRVGVVVVDPSSGDSRATGVYSGTVGSGNESTVSFSVPGTITNVYVKEGEAVRKGQVLAKVKTESLDDERNIAVAELEQVRDLYNRLKQLHDQNALPEVKWVEIQAKLKQAENAVSLANRAVADATITSPISGYVSAKLADEGQSVIPAQPIVSIVGLDNLQIAISVPEGDVNLFDRNTSASVSFESLGDLTVPGRFATKEIVADPLTRSYRVKFDIDDNGGRILPGMIGNVTVGNLGQTADSLSSQRVFVVPSKAVQLAADNRQFVWIVKNGKAERIFVRADELLADGVAIESGLQPGDTLIVSGMQKVSTGTIVESVVATGK